VAVCAAVGVTVGIIVADDGDTQEPSNRSALAHQADQYTKQLESRADAASLEFGETADHALADKAAQATSPVFPSVSEIERQAQLEGNARTYSKSATTRADLKDHNEQYRAWLESQATPSSFPSVAAIERQAQGESSSFPSVSAIERQAQGESSSFPSVSAIERQAQGESGSADEFVPGSRHMPNQ
jgi:hypothetical protein